MRLASRSTLCISLVRTNCGKFNIPFKGALWNSIENSLKSLSLWNFAKKLPSVHIIFFLSQYFLPQLNDLSP